MNVASGIIRISKKLQILAFHETNPSRMFPGLISATSEEHCMLMVSQNDAILPLLFHFFSSRNAARVPILEILDSLSSFVDSVLFVIVIGVE